MEELGTAIVERGRDAVTGRFQRGNKFKTEKARRPKLVDAGPILEAITDEFTTTELRAMLRKAWDAADKNDDAKMMMEVVRFVTAYAIGKPVTRSIVAGVRPEDFAKIFRPDSDEEEIEDESDDVVYTK